MSEINEEMAAQTEVDAATSAEPEDASAKHRRLVKECAGKVNVCFLNEDSCGGIGDQLEQAAKELSVPFSDFLDQVLAAAFPSEKHPEKPSF